MMATYTTLRPVFQILTHFTERLEQGAAPREVVGVMKDTLQKSPLSADLSELLQPIRILTGARISSMPPPNAPAEDDMAGAESVEDENEELNYDQILRLLRLTGDRVRRYIRADDHEALASLDGLVNRWMILSFTPSNQFSAAKLFESEPSSRLSSQRAMRRTLVNAAPVFSLLRSIINSMEVQAGIFVFDQLQNPAQAVTLMMVNEAVIRTSGFDREYLTGAGGFFQEIHPQDLAVLLEGLGEAIDRGEGFAQGVRMKSFRAGRDGSRGYNVWLRGDILILLPQGLMGGKRIGYFSIANVQETGELAE